MEAEFSHCCVEDILFADPGIISVPDIPERHLWTHRSLTFILKSSQTIEIRFAPKIQHGAMTEVSSTTNPIRNMRSTEWPL